MMMLFAALPTFTQTVTFEFDNAEAAAQATAQAVMLAEGEKYCWTCRFDDRNTNHGPLSEVISAAGLPYTAIVSGASSKDFKPILESIVARGGAIGVHTTSHDYMNRMLPTKCFQEVMECRLDLELDSQSPVNVFGAPYGYGSFGRNMKIVGEAIKNAGIIGGQDGERARTDLGFNEKEYVSINCMSVRVDKGADHDKFFAAFKASKARVDAGKGVNGPVLDGLSCHPWQNAAQREQVGALVKEAIANTPSLVPMTETRYFTRRLQYLNAKIKRIAVKANKATFEVTRPVVRELGAEEPLLMKLSDGRIVKVEVPSAQKLPKTYREVKGALKAAAAHDQFTYEFENTTGKDLKRVEFALRLPAGWQPGVVRKTLEKVKAGAKTVIELKANPPKGELLKSGSFYAAMQVDYEGERLWTRLLEKEASTVHAMPRDTAMVLGPVLTSKMPNKTEIAALSMPSATLPDAIAGEKWYLCDDWKDGTAPWAVTSFSKQHNKAYFRKQGVDWGEKSADKALAKLNVFDFEIDATHDGEQWNVLFTEGHGNKKNTAVYLDGNEVEFNNKGVKLAGGRHRFLVYTFNLEMEHFNMTLDVKSVQTGADAKFMRACR